MINYIGLFFEFLFLLAGVYLYLFSRGLIKTEQSQSFLKENKNVVRFGSLALIAIMLINIILHIKDIVG